MSKPGLRRPRKLPPQLLEHRWKPGQTGNPRGRAYGSRSLLSEAFLKDLHNDWLANGLEVLEQVRTSAPSTYLQVVARVVPRQLEVTQQNQMEAFSDAELNELREQLRRALAARTVESRSEGTEPPQLN